MWKKTAWLLTLGASILAGPMLGCSSSETAAQESKKEEWNPGEQSIAKADFRHSFLSAACSAQMQACCENFPYGFNRNLCLSNMETSFGSAFDWATASNSKYDGYAAFECVDGISKAADTCFVSETKLQEWFKPCFSVYVGARQPNETCYTAEECAGNEMACVYPEPGSSAIIGACVDGLSKRQAAIEGEACAGTCQAGPAGPVCEFESQPRASGKQCEMAQGLYCDASQKCSRTSVEGQSCQIAPCDSSCNCQQDECKRKPSQGEDCTGNMFEPCQDGLACFLTSHKCEQPRAVGEKCSDNSECEGALCFLTECKIGTIADGFICGTGLF